jgi:hypothetical protein
MLFSSAVSGRFFIASAAAAEAASDTVGDACERSML